MGYLPWNPIGRPPFGGPMIARGRPGGCMTARKVPQPHKRTHDEDAHFYRAQCAQYRGGHERAVFGERPRGVPPPTVPRS
jgi:hypothetical protein